MTLSQCGGSQATRSPSSANRNSCCVENGSASKALTATAAATADAADPPIPAASGTPLSIDSRTPCSTPAALMTAAAAASAVLLATSSGRLATSPETVPRRTPGSSSCTAVTVSRTASNAWPRMSNPGPTLPMLAGALARACRMAIVQARRRSGCASASRLPSDARCRSMTSANTAAAVGQRPAPLP